MTAAHRGVMASVAAGSAVALTLGVYAGVHDPSGRSFHVAVFSSAGAMKSWLATLTLLLVLIQIWSASRFKTSAGDHATDSTRLVDVHRLSGTLAFGASLPVAFHCLWALGFQTPSTRVTIHSLVGCAAYGAFAAKFTAARRPERPAWLLPVLGGGVATTFVGAWLTSARWWFAKEGLGL